jgi:hypothetical protein
MLSNNEIPVEKPARPPRLGIISLILGLVAGLGTCLALAFAAMSFTGAGESFFILLVGFVTCAQSIIGLLVITGIVLGILALVRRESKKGMAIAGLAINIISLCLTIAVLSFSIPLFSSITG